MLLWGLFFPSGNAHAEDRDPPCETILLFDEASLWADYGLDPRELRFFVNNRLTASTVCVPEEARNRSHQADAKVLRIVAEAAASSSGEAGVTILLTDGTEALQRRSVSLSGDSLADTALVVQAVLDLLAAFREANEADADSTKLQVETTAPVAKRVPVPPSESASNKGQVYYPPRDKWLVQSGLVWQNLPTQGKNRFGGNLELAYFPAFRDVPLGLIVGAEIHPPLHEAADVYRVRFWQFPFFAGLVGEWAPHPDVSAHVVLAPMLASSSLDLNDSSGYAGHHRLRRLDAGFVAGPGVAWHSSIGLGAGFSLRASYLHPGRRVYFLNTELWDEPGFSLRMLFQVSFDSSHVRNVAP